MSTITPFLDTRTPRKSALYPIVIRISIGKSQRLINTGFKIEASYWAKNAIKRNHPQASIINARLSDLQADFSRYLAECTLSGIKPDIDLIAIRKPSHSFIDFISAKQVEYQGRDMPVMINKMRRMKAELTTVFGELLFSHITGETVKRLDDYLIKVENTPNTRHKKMKMYGEMYMKAYKEGKHQDPRNPFKEYKIKTTKAQKDKLLPDEIEKLSALELTGALAIARDLFLFSFYCKGQRFGDCLLLKREAIRDGRIYFIQHKSDKAISCKIHAKLERIILKYNDTGIYLFPLVKSEPNSKTNRIRFNYVYGYKVREKV